MWTQDKIQKAQRAVTRAIAGAEKQGAPWEDVRGLLLAKMAVDEKWAALHRTTRCAGTTTATVG